MPDRTDRIPVSRVKVKPHHHYGDLSLSWDPLLLSLRTDPGYLRNICDSVTSLFVSSSAAFPRLETRASRRRGDLRRVVIGQDARDFHASSPRPPVSRYTRSIPGWPRSAPSSRVGTRSEVSRETSPPTREQRRIFRARNRYVTIAFLHGQCYPILSSGARYQSCIFIVGVPHLSLASSLLSLLPAIVSHTSGSYVVVVVELSRFFSAPSHHLRGTDFISPSERRPSCERDPDCRRTLRFKHLEVGTESRDRVFSIPLSSRRNRFNCENRVYLFRDCASRVKFTRYRGDPLAGKYCE